jgi:hypothetical protein
MLLQSEIHLTKLCLVRTSTSAHTRHQETNTPSCKNKDRKVSYIHMQIGIEW